MRAAVCTTRHQSVIRAFRTNSNLDGPSRADRPCEIDRFVSRLMLCGAEWRHFTTRSPYPRSTRFIASANSRVSNTAINWVIASSASPVGDCRLACDGERPEPPRAQGGVAPGPRQCPRVRDLALRSPEAGEQYPRCWDRTKREAGSSAETVSAHASPAISPLPKRFLHRYFPLGAVVGHGEGLFHQDVESGVL